MKKYICICLLFAFAISSIHAQSLKWENDSEGILLTEGNKPILYYQKETKSIQGKYPRANYLHPVYGIHGEVLTEDFPEDHLHQRGLFWTWHQIYVGNEKVADGWECSGIEWDVYNTNTQTNNGTAELTAQVRWRCQPPGKSKKEACVEEQTTVRYENVEGARVLDFDITLTALKSGVLIGGSEDNKGYGGFSARVYLPEDIQFYGAEGQVEPQNEAVQAGPWIRMEGSFDQEQDRKSALTIVNHKDNPKPFAGWILRKSNSMQNPVFPGRDAIELQEGKPLKLKYRVIIHDIDWSEEQLGSLLQ